MRDLLQQVMPKNKITIIYESKSVRRELLGDLKTLFCVRTLLGKKHRGYRGPHKDRFFH